MFCQANGGTLPFQLLIKGGSFITPAGWLSTNYYGKTVAAVNLLSGVYFLVYETVASEAYRIHVARDGMMLYAGEGPTPGVQLAGNK